MAAVDAEHVFGVWMCEPGNLLTLIAAMGDSGAYNFLTVSNANGTVSRWAGNGRLYIERGGIDVVSGAWGPLLTRRVHVYLCWQCGCLAVCLCVTCVSANRRCFGCARLCDCATVVAISK